MQKKRKVSEQTVQGTSGLHVILWHSGNLHLTCGWLCRSELSARDADLAAARQSETNINEV